MPMAAMSRALARTFAIASAIGADLAAPDVARIVLDPARLREVLRKFFLRARHGIAVVIEQDRAGTGGALVESRE